MSSLPLSELDAALPGLVRKIRVLDALSWPDGVEEAFLASWRAGQPELPRVQLQPRDHSADIDALCALMLFLAKDCCQACAELCEPLLADSLRC